MNKLDLYSNSTVVKSLQQANDIMHDRITEHNEIMLVVSHDRKDPRLFNIVADTMYNGKLIGMSLTFSSPEDFKRAFPELAQPVPVHLTPNTVQNESSGKVEGIKDDNIVIESIIPLNKTENIPPRMIIKLKESDKEVGCLWIKWKKSGLKYSIAASDDGKHFKIVNNLLNITSSAEVEQHNNLGELPIKTNYILIRLDSDIQQSSSSVVEMIESFRLTRSTAINT